MKRSAFWFLVSGFLACASSKPAAVKPIEKLPAAAVDVMCARFHAEGMTSELRVLKQTQSIITPTSLQALGEASFYRGNAPKPETIQAILMTPLIPVEVPATTCASRFITAAEAARSHDVMLLQFSSPFVNPFSRGQSGAFARLSLGSEASTWYWVPLMYHHDQWTAGAPFALSVME